MSTEDSFFFYLANQMRSHASQNQVINELMAGALEYVNVAWPEQKKFQWTKSPHINPLVSVMSPLETRNYIVDLLNKYKPAKKPLETVN
jgi:hypothetical protein